MSLIQSVQGVWKFRELTMTLVWKEIVVRYKQAYLGVALSILKPLLLTLMFTLLRGLINFNTGPIPYPLLTFAAMLPWVFFQEGTSQGVNSVVGNATLINKIYFPREIFPIVAVSTKFVELGIDLLILVGMMLCYGYYPSVYMLWVFPLLIYLVLATLSVCMAGAALNVFYRDVSQLLPVGISMVMYASPVLYPLSMVKETLLVKQSAGAWSNVLYYVYTINPMAGLIDAFQKVILERRAPDLEVMWCGMIFVTVLLPVSYTIFKRAEAYFSDVI